MQEGVQENMKRHCNKHKSLTSVYFSKRFTKKEDNNHAQQLGKFDMLVPNILQSITMRGSSTLRYYVILESNPEQSKVWKDDKNEINENGDDIGKDHVTSISGPQVTSINVTPSSPGTYSSYKLLARLQHDAYMIKTQDAK